MGELEGHSIAASSGWMIRFESSSHRCWSRMSSLSLPSGTVTGTGWPRDHAAQPICPGRRGDQVASGASVSDAVAGATNNKPKRVSRTTRSENTLLTNALHQAQQIVRIFSIRRSLDVLVAKAALGDDNIDAVPFHFNKEAPLSEFNPANGLFLCDSPTATISILATHMRDAFVGVLPI